MCLQNWDFAVLTNSFLVHRPTHEIRTRNTYMSGRENVTRAQGVFHLIVLAYLREGMT